MTYSSEAAEPKPKIFLSIFCRLPPHPPAGGKSAEAKRKILSPRKTDFRFAESVLLKPHALPEYLEGRTPKEKHPFLFQKKFHPRQIRNARSVFSFGVAGVLASTWGLLRAYDLGQSHHARSACLIRGSAGNESELFGIMTTSTIGIMSPPEAGRGPVYRIILVCRAIDFMIKSDHEFSGYSRHNRGSGSFSHAWD